LVILKQASEVAQKITNGGSSAVTLSLVARAQARAGDRHEALGTMLQAIKAARRAETKSSAADAARAITLARVDVLGAKRALEMKEKRGTYILDTIALVLADEGNVKKALEAAQKIVDPSTKVSALSEVASALTKTGEERQALATLKQALEVAEKIEDADKRASALRSIALILFEAGGKQRALATLKQALEVSQEIEYADTRASELCNIALGLFAVGGKQEAFATLKQAVEVAQKNGYAYSKAPTLHSIALALFQMGKKQQALATLKQSLEAAEKIEYADFKADFLRKVSITLATVALPGNKKLTANGAVVRRLKKAFTPQEQQLARQLVEMMTAT
jgi:tetratricopeptide (TPR) repeat protein